MKGHRGPARQLDSASIAVAVSLSVRNFATLYGVSPRTVRGWVAAGIPHLKFPGKLVILRVEGGAWVEQHFRADKVGRLVDEVLADLRR